MVKVRKLKAGKKKSPIILASASQRRQQLLAAAGYKFKVAVSQIDESAFSSEECTPIEYAKALAHIKAAEVAKQYPDSIVIGADTVVDFDGQIIGKALDSAHAEKITRMLFSRPHKVITGLALICRTRNLEIVEADVTAVYPKKLTEAQIAGHIASGVWQDKAGAYAIQECDPFVDHIEGSFTNVMGMPMELFERIFPHNRERKDRRDFK
jgi:septum formation protein